MDPENEHLIQQALSALTKGKTILTIAHRLATIEHADQILVVEGWPHRQQGHPCGADDPGRAVSALYRDPGTGRGLEAGMKDRGKQSLYASGEDYLEAIPGAQKQKGMVRSVDVARHLEVHKAQRLQCGGDPARRRLSYDGRGAISCT